MKKYKNRYIFIGVVSFFLFVLFVLNANSNLTEFVSQEKVEVFDFEYLNKEATTLIIVAGHVKLQIFIL